MAAEVAVVGLGHMGVAIAERILDAGCPVAEDDFISLVLQLEERAGAPRPTKNR